MGWERERYAWDPAAGTRSLVGVLSGVFHSGIGPHAPSAPAVVDSAISPATRCNTLRLLFPTGCPTLSVLLRPA